MNFIDKLINKKEPSSPADLYKEALEAERRAHSNRLVNRKKQQYADEAVRLYTLLAEMGNVDAQYKLGLIKTVASYFQNNNGTSNFQHYDYDNGIKLLENAAKHNIAGDESPVAAMCEDIIADTIEANGHTA